MQQFSLPTKIYFGEESLKELQQYADKKVLLVIDPFLKESGLVDRVTRYLNVKTLKMYSRIAPDPTVELVTDGVQELLQYQPEIVVVCGGGSAIDAAKSILYFAQQKDNTLGNILFIAIPTTSGTGSEVTNFSVITHGERKIPIVDERLSPDIAILDALLVRSVPSKITADTGLDVLTHAIEAYVSTNASLYTDALAEKAVELVFTYLPDAVQNGNSLPAREALHNASTLAGIAFTNAGLGINHALAHTLGGKFHIPHGCANALLLSSVVEMNAEHSKYANNKYMLLQKRLTKPFHENSLSESILTLMRMCHMPLSLKDLHITIEEKEYYHSIPQLAERALQDPCCSTNPYRAQVKDFQYILEKIY